MKEDITCPINSIVAQWVVKCENDLSQILIEAE